MNIWQSLYKRVIDGGEYITSLAPMADVTDRAYRFIIAEKSRMNQACGGPDLLWTEFVSCDGICSMGRDHLLRDLQYGEFERNNIIPQIFGSNPENFTKTAELLVELGFKAIDINMGCPVKVINKQGAGACLIQTPELAQEIVRATRLGAPGIPISVKTRIGWTRPEEYQVWISALLESGIDALIIHARTRKEMSDYPPHWDIFKSIVEMAQPYGIPVIANGGIMSHSDGVEICKQSGAHGYMVGKGTFGSPWFFDTTRTRDEIPLVEILQTARQHTELYRDWVMNTIGNNHSQKQLQFAEHFIDTELEIKGKALNLMKKNYRCYFQGYPGAKEFREKLMNASTVDEIVSMLDTEIAHLERHNIQ